MVYPRSRYWCDTSNDWIQNGKCRRDVCSMGFVLIETQIARTGICVSRTLSNAVHEMLESGQVLVFMNAGVAGATGEHPLGVLRASGRKQRWTRIYGKC